MAATLAGTLSGLPSTVFAAATGHSILEAVRAAGTLIPGRRHRPGVIAGCAAHGLITLFWTGWIAAAARRRPLAARDGAAAGLAIAVLDLGIIGRRYPAIRALPAIPQYLDHVAFGVVAAAVLGRTGPPRPSAGQRRRR